MPLVILGVGVVGGYSENNKIIFIFCLCSASESEIKCFFVTRWILIGCHMSLWSFNTKKNIDNKTDFFYILLLPAPVVSLRTIASSMYLIFIRTNRKYILPTITSLRWYLQECKKGENNSLYTFVSQFYIQYGILKR